MLIHAAGLTVTGEQGLPAMRAGRTRKPESGLPDALPLLPCSAPPALLCPPF